MAILVWKVSRSRLSSVAALLVLVFSGSFVAYSTSGLENCLIFLLSALFFWVYFDRDRYDFRSLLLMTALFSLSVVNRMDTALLLAPALAFAYFRQESVGLLRLAGRRCRAVAAAPVGGLLARLLRLPLSEHGIRQAQHGHPQLEYLVRGVWYYVLSTLQDPITPDSDRSGLGARSVARRAKISVPLIGVALYLAYILKIGGDFMRGRFLTAPLFVVRCCSCRSTPSKWARIRVTPVRLLVAASRCSCWCRTSGT